jgi:DNA primase
LFGFSRISPGAASERSLVQYPAEKIAEVRDRVDIEQVVGRAVRLTRRGQRLVGLCPFHSEKTPSFQVSPDKGLYHCFGCKAGGDVFDFIMKIEGLDFPTALKLLADQAGVKLPEQEQSPREREEKKRRDRLFSLNAGAATYYQRMLEQAPDAMRYLLEERGLTKSAIEHFRIGWAPPGWENLAHVLQQKGVSAEEALEAGLLAKSPKDGRIYDRLRARVIFPIEVPGGSIVGFGARRADWIDREGPKYLNSPESPIYEKSTILYGLHLARDEIRRSRRAILVEGYLDVVGVVMAGLPETVAACGTALTRSHAKTLRRLAPEVVTCYDGDEAGREATRTSAEILLSEGLSVRVVELPEGEDPDSFVQKHGAESLKKLVDEAPSAIDLFLRRARSAHAGGGVAGTTKAMEAVKPLILAIRDPLERDVAIGACATQLGVEARVLARHLASKEPLAPVRQPAPQTRALTFPVVETELLKTLLESPADVVRELDQRHARKAFSSAAIQAAIDAGIAAHETSASFDAPRAIEAMRTVADLDEATVSRLRQKLVEDLPEKDISACVTKLLKAHRDNAIREIKQRIEQETNPEVVRELAKEASRLMATRI